MHHIIQAPQEREKMKQFHIGDILSVTTGRLVSSRHIDGLYEILNFLTGDELYTHQLPRAMRECEPWLKTQFPYLMADWPAMQKQLKGLDDLIALDGDDKAARERTIRHWVEATRHEVKFPDIVPEMLPVYEMGASMHTHIDPIQEAEAMVGKDKVIPVQML
jgi:hypothetical protein